MVGYHKVICLNSECKPWIIHIMSLLVILSTYALEDGQTATSVPHHHTRLPLGDSPCARDADDQAGYRWAQQRLVGGA